MARKVGATLVLLGWVGVLGSVTTACEESAPGDLEIHNIQPRAGATAGEQPVMITGANFRQDIGYTVYFGATRAGQVTIMDDTTLVVATPHHDPGVLDVVVAADDGPAYKIVGGFEYTEQGGNVMEQVGEPGAAQGEERF